MTKNFFKLSEQVCPCCKTGRFAPDFLDKLNLARSFSPVVFIINSGFRCYKHNLEIGGSSTSSHLVGVAADIRVQSSFERYCILDSLLKAGFTRIGLGKDFIHTDLDFTKPQNVIWEY